MTNHDQAFTHPPALYTSLYPAQHVPRIRETAERVEIEVQKVWMPVQAVTHTPGGLVVLETIYEGIIDGVFERMREVYVITAEEYGARLRLRSRPHSLSAASLRP